MVFSGSGRRYGLQIVAAFLATVVHAVDTVTQTYCSNQNTGVGSNSTTDTYGSLDSCDNICKFDYAFAIIQGTECWCSNYAPANQQSVSLCDTVCPGWPYEFCGSDTADLFGYVSLTSTAWGTMPASTSTTAAAETTATSTTAAAQTTVFLTSERTIVSTKAIVSTELVSITVTPTALQSSSSSTLSSALSGFTSTSQSSAQPLTSSSLSTSASALESTILTISAIQDTVAASTSAQAVTIFETLTATQQVTVVPVASSTSSSSSLSTSTSAVEQQITVSGAVVTQFITAVATAAAESSSAAIINESSTSSHLSKGASAGIAIGAIIAAALLGLLFFFCCGRRRGRSGDDESGLNRNTSVLSKAGLLRNTSAKRGPKLQTAGLAGQGGAENPMSATTAMTMSTSRDSRPVFVDQRLNPNAWVTHHPNASQSTLGSLHDHRDYSRPLEVRNPDAP